MNWDKKSSRYILLASISFVLVMFGTRFVTLRFGQVFPEQSPTDRNRMTTLEARIQALEGRTAELDSANARLANLEEVNKRLTEEVQAAKSVKPVVIYQDAVNASSTSKDRSEPAKATEVVRPEPISKEDLSQTVHRGDSMQKVRRVFGRPNKVTDFIQSECWYYGDFNRNSVTFKDGGVSEWSGMPVEP